MLNDFIIKEEKGGVSILDESLCMYFKRFHRNFTPTSYTTHPFFF